MEKYTLISISQSFYSNWQKNFDILLGYFGNYIDSEIHTDWTSVIWIFLTI